MKTMSEQGQASAEIHARTGEIVLTVLDPNAGGQVMFLTREQALELQQAINGLLDRTHSNN